MSIFYVTLGQVKVQLRKVKMDGMQSCHLWYNLDYGQYITASLQLHCLHEEWLPGDNTTWQGKIEQQSNSPLNLASKWWNHGCSQGHNSCKAGSGDKGSDGAHTGHSSQHGIFIWHFLLLGHSLQPKLHQLSNVHTTRITLTPEVTEFRLVPSWEQLGLGCVQDRGRASQRCLNSNLNKFSDN